MQCKSEMKMCNFPESAYYLTLTVYNHRRKFNFHLTLIRLSMLTPQNFAGALAAVSIFMIFHLVIGVNTDPTGTKLVCFLSKRMRVKAVIVCNMVI